MIIKPNNAKHQSGTTYGPQTHPPTHSLFLLPMAWPSFTSTNTFAAQSCEPPTQALKVRFGNPTFNTYEKQRIGSQRPHGSSTHLPSPPHDSLMRWRGIQAALVSQRAANGSGVRMQKTPRCETEKGGGSQRVSAATPDVRRLIRAMENQRHCCCGACPYVHLTLAPMNASRNILPRASSWPCKQSRVSSTFQQPLLWRGVALFRPFLPCAILV
ncbi:hypothetical protein TcCL_Unassigned00084 [Trypanosoma cruzi]|nr:hypothetical protein TcCL_Unassigned00084 [Trypanosoma cruzi]